MRKHFQLILAVSLLAVPSTSTLAFGQDQPVAKKPDKPAEKKTAQEKPAGKKATQDKPADKKAGQDAPAAPKAAAADAQPAATSPQAATAGTGTAGATPQPATTGSATASAQAPAAQPAPGTPSSGSSSSEEEEEQPVVGPYDHWIRDPSDPQEQPHKYIGEIPVSRQGLGLDAGALQTGGLIIPPQPTRVYAAHPNGFAYSGFLRAPMRLGLGSGSALPEGVNSTRIHSPPRVPDSDYTNWQYTNNVSSPWAEMVFAYGNAMMTGNVAVATYNFTDSSYENLTAQRGIYQAWVNVFLPELFGPRGGIMANIGGFNAGYGGFGRYDAGVYETYLFGRTHVTGYTATAFYDVTDDLTLHFEQGFGARLDTLLLTAGVPQVDYLPYGGPVQQYPTILNHVHAGVTYQENYRLAAHYLRSWTQAAETPEAGDGSETSFGGEFRWMDSKFGDGMIGYARLNAKNALRVAGAYEALHAWEGWALRDSFFGYGGNSTGNGHIDTIAGQWSFSVPKYVLWPMDFYGEGPDLIITLFGMYNHVGSSDPLFAGATQKLKFGGMLTYTPLSWFGAGIRYDLVQPDMNDSRYSFQEVSPRIIFSTEFSSHEQIIVQYTHYMLKDRTRLVDPFDQQKATPDKDVITIVAEMYW